ncbi:MAG: RNA-directed DNA polymerase [Xanthomonadales bacterium]|nr:RNA-directed DNA polymerase [Xanthomonadales bacterium]
MMHSLCYPLDQSPLYMAGSKVRLCELLGITTKDLRLLLALENYREWTAKQKLADKLANLPAKSRNIEEPKPLLRLLHKRIALLLDKIEKPDFLYSARKGCSYFSNALQHQRSEGAVRVDIKSFYPSVRQRMVKEFFESQMRMPADVAHTLAKLCCHDGKLPTGSPLSPILSYFACSPFFSRVAAIADRLGLQFTLYVDDMVFSGKGANRALADQIKRELAGVALIGHKVSYFPAGGAKVITGAAVFPDRIEVPFKRQRRIRKFEEAFAKTTNVATRGAGTPWAAWGPGAGRPGPGPRARPVEVRLAALEARTPEIHGKANAKRRKKPVGKSIMREIARKAAVLREHRLEADVCS